MDDTKRNLVVGAFVVVALVALGVMILLFGQAPRFITRGYQISIYFSTAGPIQRDDGVFLNGINIGQVEFIEPLDDIREGVRLVARVDDHIRIPIDAQPVIHEQTMGFGPASIRIEVGPRHSQEALPTDGTGVLHGRIVTGIAEIIPQPLLDTIERATVSIADLAEAFTPVARNLDELTRPLSIRELDAMPEGAEPLANLSTVVQRLDQAVKSFNDVMADPDNQQNIAVMIENFRTISERGLDWTDQMIALADQLSGTADTLDDRIQEVAAGLMGSTDRLSLLFDRLNEIAEKISTGQGAAARFINDPELYEALTLTARRLQMAIDELRFLLMQWQERGLRIEGGLFGR